MRILLIEDEVQLADLVVTALAKRGMVVDHAPTLEFAREAVLNFSHDAIVLDRKLPDGEGLSLIPYLRAHNDAVPIVVLSAMGSLDNRLSGLDGGADDYLTKPFAMDELVARLRAVARRAPQMRPEVLVVGGVELEVGQSQVRVNGETIQLPRREMLALEALMRREGRVISRAALNEAVYSFDDEVSSNTLDAQLSRLRKRIAPAGVEIHAVRGIGYLLRPVP